MVEDLSKVHRPASGLFPQPAPGAEDAWRLSPEQITFYHETGYLPGVRVLTDEQVEVLRAELNVFFQPGHPGQRAVVRVPHQRIGRSRSRCCFTPWARGESARAFTICCGIRRSRCRPASCWAARCASGTISCSASRRARRRRGLASGLFVLDADTSRWPI